MNMYVLLYDATFDPSTLEGVFMTLEGAKKAGIILRDEYLAELEEPSYDYSGEWVERGTKYWILDLSDTAGLTIEEVECGD